MGTPSLPHPTPRRYMCGLGACLLLVCWLIMWTQRSDGDGDRVVRALPPVAQCKVYSDVRGTLERAAQAQPAVLYSFPESGEGWLRRAVEYVTGTQTGSLSTDPVYYADMTGEQHCSWMQSLIAASSAQHPWFGPHGLGHGGFVSQGQKCKSSPRGRKPLGKFTRAVLLVRDPYSVLWAGYKRHMSKGLSAREALHTFHPRAWLRVSVWLAYRYRDALRDARKYGGIESRMRPDWDFRSAGAVHIDAENSFLFVRYEDLTDPLLGERKLGHVLTFVDPTHAFSGQGGGWLRGGAKHDGHRLRCAVTLASDFDARAAPSEDRDVTIATAFADQAFVCSLWQIFGQYAWRYGYEPFGGAKCNSEELRGALEDYVDPPPPPMYVS